MANEKKEQAHNLYFQSNLTQTEIAKLLDVSRRTIHTWIREGGWDNLKKSAEHIPSMIAEQCYYLMGNLNKNLLGESRYFTPVRLEEAQTLHKLSLTINKLKNRNTNNENVEMFTFFLDRLKEDNPRLADEIFPYIQEYMAERVSAPIMSFPIVNYSSRGSTPDPDINFDEQDLDKQDDAWLREDQIRRRAEVEANAQEQAA